MRKILILSIYSIQNFTDFTKKISGCISRNYSNLEIEHHLIKDIDVAKVSDDFINILFTEDVDCMSIIKTLSKIKPEKKVARVYPTLYGAMHVDGVATFTTYRDASHYFFVNKSIYLEPKRQSL